MKRVRALPVNFVWIAIIKIIAEVYVVRHKCFYQVSKQVKVLFARCVTGIYQYEVISIFLPPGIFGYKKAEIIDCTFQRPGDIKVCDIGFCSLKKQGGERGLFLKFYNNYFFQSYASEFLE